MVFSFGFCSVALWRSYSTVLFDSSPLVLSANLSLSIDRWLPLARYKSARYCLATSSIVCIGVRTIETHTHTHTHTRTCMPTLPHEGGLSKPNNR